MVVLGCISQDAPEITQESRHGTEGRNWSETENSIVIHQLFILYGLSACLQSGNKQDLSKQGNSSSFHHLTWPIPNTCSDQGLGCKGLVRFSDPTSTYQPVQKRETSLLTGRHSSPHKQLTHLLLFHKPTQRLGGKSWHDWANTSHTEWLTCIQLASSSPYILWTNMKESKAETCLCKFSLHCWPITCKRSLSSGFYSLRTRPMTNEISSCQWLFSEGAGALNEGKDSHVKSTDHMGTFLRQSNKRNSLKIQEN